MSPERRRLAVIGLAFAAVHLLVNYATRMADASSWVARMLSLPADLLLPLLPINEDGRGAYPLLMIANSLLWGLLVAVLAGVAIRKRTAP